MLMQYLGNRMWNFKSQKRCSHDIAKEMIEMIVPYKRKDFMEEAGAEPVIDIGQILCK